MSELTPIRRQYLDVKRRYPHAIVFFRLGDFYETFDEDAQLCARELEITLTSKPMGKGLRVPLAGIPYHAVDSYIAKLIAKGYKVALCEQVSDPATSKGLVDRRVVRVVTPGTLIENTLLDERANNYLMAIAPSPRRRGSDDAWSAEIGFAYADISTGEFVAGVGSPEAVATEITRVRPAELLFPASLAPPAWVEGSTHATPCDALWFDHELATVTLQEHFRAATADAFGLDPRSAAVGASAGIIMYLRENQAASVPLFTAIRAHRPAEFLALDAHTVRNLELFSAGLDNRREGSLLHTLDLTSTSLGSRLLRRRIGQPLCDLPAIEARLDEIAFCHESALRRARLMGLLAKLPDIERIVARAVGGSIQPRELVALRQGLEAIPMLRGAIEERPDGRIASVLGRLHPCEDVTAAIAQAIADQPAAVLESGDVVRAGFSEELDRLRLITRDVRRFMAEMEAGERERTGIKTLKIGYNRVFGYYIEVSKANAAAVPDHYERRQSLVNGERFTTQQLREYETQMLSAKDRAQELETAIYRGVCAQVVSAASQLLGVAGAIAELDVASALAEAAARFNYVRPEMDDGDAIEISSGRHPMVERGLAAGAFVANDTALASSCTQIVVLTGPNMAGKSTYLRQVALITLMAQIGSFVPAAAARIGVVDRIFTRVGAGDDLTSGQSTFMVEMTETSAILHNATSRSLVILDEIGRGTSTYDGMSIARAVVEYLHNKPGLAAKTIFATHYHELTELASALPRVSNYNVAVAEEQGRIVFLRRIVPGGADRSYGVQVAELAGLPKAVVQRAREVMRALEDEHAPGSRSRRVPDPQMSLFAATPPDDGLRRELAEIDLDTMTPLDAMTRLYELRERARGAPGSSEKSVASGARRAQPEGEL